MTFLFTLAMSATTLMPYSLRIEDDGSLKKMEPKWHHSGTFGENSTEKGVILYGSYHCR